MGEPRPPRLRLAHPQPGRVRRLRPRHQGDARLDHRRHPPLQHPPAPAAAEHDARVRPRGAGRRVLAERALERRAARTWGACRRRWSAGAGEPGFTPISWDDALELAADRIRAAGPERMGMYLTSRGTANETYYAAQKAARAMGTNAIDNAARVCHSPSTFGLKEALGVAATTCSYTDWLHSDLIVFIGSNVANNQPVTTKYLHHAKRERRARGRGEPLPRAGHGALLDPLGVRPARCSARRSPTDFFQLNVGGDIAFLTGTLRHLVDSDWVDRDVRRAEHHRLPGARGAPGRAHLGGARGRRGRRPGGHARLRATAGRGRPRRARVVDGRDPARARRGQRARDREPRPGARLGRPRGMRVDADPRALRRAGRRRDGLLLHRPARRADGRRRTTPPRCPPSGASRCPRSAGRRRRR